MTEEITKSAASFVKCNMGKMFLRCALFAETLVFLVLFNF